MAWKLSTGSQEVEYQLQNSEESNADMELGSVKILVKL
jgi:hypothetical protein